MASGNGAQRGELPHGLWAALGVRRVMFLVLSLIVLQLAIASAAQAESFYWYGKGNSTCWQTGTPGSPSESCDTVGANYLPTGPHMKEGAIGADVQLINEGINGDYCNYAHIGEGLDTSNANDQSTYTGFPAPSPIGSYQEGNHYNPPDVCQASGTTWGQVLRGNAANGNCSGASAPCNIQHFVSLGALGAGGAGGNNNRPWSSAFGSPSLVISAEADPQKVEAPNAWGFLCPVLKAPGGAIVEYCLSQWHTGSGSFPAYKGFDEAGPCNFGGGQVYTGFAPGTKFAEMVSGSNETFEWKNNPASRTFTARITPANLEAALTAIEAKGCGPQSRAISEYALVGIEQGVEGGGMTLIGGHTANLKVWTEYTRRAPVVFYNLTGGLNESWLGENGSWNWTYWQLGIQGSPALTMSPNGTEQFVYYNAGGKLYERKLSGGSWTTTSLGTTLTGSPAAVIAPDGERYIFYNHSGVLYETWLNWQGWNTASLGHAISSDPAVMVNPANETFVFYNYNGTLQESWWNNTNWGYDWFPKSAGMIGKPAIGEAANGEQYVFYNHEGALYQTWRNYQGWNTQSLGHGITGSPAVAVNSNSHQYVFYNYNGTLQESWWDGTAPWKYQYWESQKISGTPSVDVSPADGEGWVFFASNGALEEGKWLGSNFTFEGRGHGMNVSDSPSSAVVGGG